MKSNFEFYKLVSKKYPKIDVLINNVGAIFMKRSITNEGLEKTFALNHMSYFVLSNLFAESEFTSPGWRQFTVKFLSMNL